jgi:adenylate cyclase
MTNEIERKFLPSDPPAASMLGEGESLRQGYVAEEDDVSVRVRISPSAATLTVKAGRGVARTEVELPISLDQAEALWPHTADRRIGKTRFRVPLAAGALVAEVDLYHGPLDGLCTVEVEFSSVEAADAFDPPTWFGREVTGEKAWTNAALARHGRPE